MAVSGGRPVAGPLVVAVAALAVMTAGFAVLALEADRPGRVATGGAERSTPSPTPRAGDEASTASPAPAEPDPDAPTRARVERVLAELSTEEKVGQLLVADVRGDHPTDVSPAAAAENVDRYGVATPAEVVERHQLGGIVYFTYAPVTDPPDPQRTNLRAPDQIAALSRGLQQAAEASHGVPLLIATDQEHGLITRTPAPFTRMPGPMALGAVDDPELAEASAAAAARELRAVGINVAFAPSADVNTEPANPVIGVRSPGASPALVGRTVAAQVRGLAAGGVGTTAKHFPGHGSVDVDSHEALPTVGDPADVVRATALPPFADAVAAGVDAVMPGHLAVPALDAAANRPATTSPAILEGVLRDELGFDGVVVTDALDMDAVRAVGGPADVALAALHAGADLLLMPPELPRVRAALLAAAADGRLSQARLDAAVRRVLTWKAELGLLDGADGADGAEAADDADAAASHGDVVGHARHRELAARIARRAITAVDAACGVLPATGDGTVAVVGPRDGGAPELADALGGLVHSLTPTGMEPGADAVGQAREAAAGAALTVQVSTAAWDHSGQRDLNAELADAAGALVVVSTAEPYDAAHLRADVHLAAYDRGVAALRAVAGVLRGDAAPGRLPVPVGDHDVGHGRALAACD